MSVGFTYANVGWVEDDAPYDDIYIRHDLLTTPGQLITHDSVTNLSQAVPAGTPGQILIANGTAVGMAWGAASGLGSITVTPVGPLTVSGSPVSLGGTVTITNTALDSIPTFSWKAGSLSSVGGANSVAAGHLANTTAADSVAAGYQAQSGLRSIAMGSGTTINVSDSVGLGTSAVSSGTQSCLLGASTIVLSQGAIVLGYGANVQASATYAIAAGHSASVSASSARSVVAGYNSSATAADALVLGPNSTVSSANCSAVGSGLTNAVPLSTLIGSSTSATSHCVYSTGYFQSARACSAQAVRDFAGGDPVQTINFPSFPANILFVRATYDTFTTANNAALTSWSGANPELLTIGTVPNATYLVTLNVEMNYLAVGATLNVNTFQIIYDANGTTTRVGIASVAQNDVNYLNHRVSVSGQFRVGAAPVGNHRVYAVANSLNGALGIALSNVQMTVTRLV